jgi:hypothetical protein
MKPCRSTTKSKRLNARMAQLLGNPSRQIALRGQRGFFNISAKLGSFRLERSGLCANL